MMSSTALIINYLRTLIFHVKRAPFWCGGDGLLRAMSGPTALENERRNLSGFGLQIPFTSLDLLCNERNLFSEQELFLSLLAFLR